jgi:lipoprotein-anchoring transpeptidase ErfK/SrfK
MFRAFNFILISILSWSAVAQQPIAQAKAYLSNQAFEEILFVSIKEQKLYHIKDDKIVKEYVISSSAYGTGNKAGSNKTPLGLHKVNQKYGDKTPINGRMVGRVFYEEIATIYTDSTKSKTDDVTSRIFWLEGLEKGKNKGDGIDSYKRYIYIHGTSEEGRLGKPASHGCIRMKNKEVIGLYKAIEVGTLVLIL